MGPSAHLAIPAAPISVLPGGRAAFLAARSGGTGGVLADEPAKAPRAPDAILNQYCNVCHLTGWNGAPLSGDANDWQPRLATGFASVAQKPPQGLNTLT